MYVLLDATGLERLIRQFIILYCDWIVSPVPFRAIFMFHGNLPNKLWPNAVPCDVEKGGIIVVNYLTCSFRRMQAV